MTLNEKQKEVLKLLDKKYILLYGGSRSGKSLLICYIIILLCITYPTSRHLIARYSFANAKKTIWLQTLVPMCKKLEKKGICQIKSFSGIVEFENGSAIMLGGLEPSRIDSVLGGEFATVFVNEANENKWETIELLFSRLNSVAKNKNTSKIIRPRFFADLNPTSQHNWDYKFFKLKQNPSTAKKHNQADLITSLQMNPKDNRENLNSDYLEVLQSMSTAKRKRFWDGDWSNYEGLIYEITDDHIIDSYNEIERLPITVGIDFGYTHKFVWLLVAYDQSNERYIIVDEYVKTKRTINSMIPDIKEVEKGWKIEKRISDHDSEDRATLDEYNLKTIPANKNVETGIAKVIDLIERKKILIMRNCTNTINELFSYRWDEKSKHDRKPVKENDHCLDALRYIINTKDINSRIIYTRF